MTTLADVSTLEGVQQVGSGWQGAAVTGLAWVGGTLSGIVQNALISIAP